MSQAASCPAVVRLFGRCRPSAISRAIRAIVVDTVNGMMRAGTRPHVAIEDSKVIPFRTHRDAPPAVPLITPVISVSATLPHDDPDVILGRATGRRGACEAVCFAARASRPPIFITQTSAGSRLAAPKILASDRLFRSAIALTDPPDLTVGVRLRIFPQHSQATKPLTGRVLGNIVTHQATPGVSPRPLTRCGGTLLGEFYHA